MILEPVPDFPALLAKGERSWICVADLHIGIEVQLRRAGFNIPSQTPRMLSDLESLSTKAPNLLILGDIKHRIPSLSYREDREIPPLISRLMKAYKQIVVLAGNHDGGLKDVLPEDILAYAGSGTCVDDIGFCHGHVWPSKAAMNAKKLVMGHVHPSVLLKDSIGSRMNEKCWARGVFKEELVKQKYGTCPRELVIVPAFNPLLIGTPVNSMRGTYLGPLFRNGFVDEESLQVYLLDGSNLGHMARV